MVLPLAFTTEVMAIQRVTHAKVIPIKIVITAIIALESSFMPMDICIMAEKQKTAKVMKNTRDFLCLRLLRFNSCKKDNSEFFLLVFTFVKVFLLFEFFGGILYRENKKDRE